MNTYVNVVLLRLLLSVEQLAKIDQHLEEELIFCAQPNPLSQSGKYLPWINLLLHTSVWFTYDRLDVCLDLGDLLYGPQLLLRERDRVTCTWMSIITETFKNVNNFDCNADECCPESWPTQYTWPIGITGLESPDPRLSMHLDYCNGQRRSN